MADTESIAQELVLYVVREEGVSWVLKERTWNKAFAFVGIKAQVSMEGSNLVVSGKHSRRALAFMSDVRKTFKLIVNIARATQAYNDITPMQMLVAQYKLESEHREFAEAAE